mgnify:CR=1 FL=1
MTPDTKRPIGRDHRIMAYEETQTFSCDAPRLFNIIRDPAQWPAEGEPRILKSREADFVQVAFADATRATLNLTRSAVGSGCEVSLSHDLCTDLAQVNHWRDYWASFFESLRKRVEL